MHPNFHNHHEVHGVHRINEQHSVNKKGVEKKKKKRERERERESVTEQKKGERERELFDQLHPKDFMFITLHYITYLLPLDELSRRMSHR
jgi:hypothetical protein